MTRVSDLERSVVDSIKEMEKIAGLEELLANLSLVRSLNVDKLIEYLNYHNTQSLYKKVGYLLSIFRLQNKLPTRFFDYCKEKRLNTTIYLTQDAKDQGRFDSEWKIVVPKFINVENNAI